MATRAQTQGINGTSIAVMLAGVVILYSGIKGAKISDTVRGFLKGKGQQAKDVVVSDVSPYTYTPGEQSGGYGGTLEGGSKAKNQAIAKLLAAPYGWSTGDQWNALLQLWDRESGWSNTADTRVTHAGGDNAQSTVFAYGIAQARPATKYPKPGQPPDLGGISSASAQIAWGLAYIKSTYGNPVNALAHENSNGWY